ncbi:MAG: SprB repeat-containing protein, partial [Fluviicola sp.]|nr:SprB repeat-containing protein [Fluviicola sp.]
DLNGCQITSNITLTEPTELDISMTVSVYNGGYNLTGCSPDGWIDLTVQGGSSIYQFNWSNGFITEDLTNLQNGLYSVIVTDLNGCQISIDTVLSQPPVITSSIYVVSDYNGEDISCFGSSDGSVSVDVLGGTPIFSYEWIDTDGNIVSTSQLANGLNAGLYTVNVVDANGCFTSNSISLSNPTPFLYNINVSTNYNGSNISCFGASDGGINLDVAGGTPGYSYHWTDSNGVYISDVEDPILLISGKYNVEVTDLNG